MSKIEEQSKEKNEGEIRYLTPLDIETKSKKRFCRFKRAGIKYVDYKDPEFLKKSGCETSPVPPLAPNPLF